MDFSSSPFFSELLDPACGSGTFLLCAIRHLREQGLKGGNLVEHSLEPVIARDVHPVAALMAKANILLGPAKELARSSVEVNRRVNMADMLMTEGNKRRGYLGAEVGPNEEFHTPLETLQRGRDLDARIDNMVQFARLGKSAKPRNACRKKIGDLKAGATWDNASFSDSGLKGRARRPAGLASSVP